MSKILSIARWQAAVDTFASFTFLLGMVSAAFIIMPAAVHAGEKPGSARFFQRSAVSTAQEAQTQAAERSPGLRAQLAFAEQLRGRLKVVAHETAQVRQAAVEMRDMVLAGCLLPHERRAQQLLTASTQTYERMLRDLSATDGAELSQNLDMLQHVERLERQLRGERSLCQGVEEVAFSESGPPPIFPQAPVKLKSPRQAPPPPLASSPALAQRGPSVVIY